MTGFHLVYGLLICGLLLLEGSGSAAQSASGASISQQTASEPTAALERELFAAIREGDAKKFLSYVPEQGMNVGPQAKHMTRSEVEQQFAQHRDLYCKLFDSSCIQSAIRLDASA